jgi:hypothetical protein
MGETESRQSDEAKMSKPKTTALKIQELENEISRKDKQIDLKRDFIVKLGKEGNKRRAIDETDSLRQLTAERDRKRDNLKLLRKGQYQLGVAEDLIETQQCIKEMTDQKFQLIATLDPADIKDTNLDSRAADRGLEKILQHAGMTDESRESDTRQNEALFDELMRESVNTTATTTTTTTTTTTQKNYIYDDDIMKF